MEFTNELNFLSVIEEERESADGDSLEGAEKLKWKTDYREIALSNKIGIGDRKFKEKVASKIPIRQDRLQVPGFIFRKEMKENQNEQITSFQDDEGDKGHEISRVSSPSETDSTFSCRLTKIEKEKQIQSRVVEVSVEADESTENSKRGENINGKLDNENVSEENLFSIAPSDKEARNSSIKDDSVSLSSEGESKRPTSFSFMINTSEGKNSEIERENKPKYFEVEINVSESPQDHYSSTLSREGVNENPFSVEEHGSLQSFHIESIHRNSEYIPCDNECCEREVCSFIQSNHSSTLNDDSNTVKVNNSSESISLTISENISPEDNMNMIEGIENPSSFEGVISMKNSFECSGLRFCDETDTLAKCGAINPKMENSTSDVGYCGQSGTYSETADDPLTHDIDNNLKINMDCSKDTTALQNLKESLETLYYLHENTFCNNNSNVEQDFDCSVMNTQLPFDSSNEENKINTNSQLWLRPEDKHTVSATNLIENNQKNMILDEAKLEFVLNEKIEDIIDNEMSTDQDFPKNPSTKFSGKFQLGITIIENDLNSNLQDTSDHFGIDVVEYPLECDEPDENILEAPAEFRTDFENNNFFIEKVESFTVLPQPPSVPEEESPICDNHNTCRTETNETNQPARPTDESTQENLESSNNVSNLSSTRSLSLTINNSTEDNDHVKQGGGNGNVSAFEHVGIDAPIQRHDMLQIGSTERGEIVDRIGINSAVPDLRSSDRRGLRRSVSFNDRFSGGVVNEVKKETKSGLGEVLDLKFTSEQYRFFCANENKISDDFNFSNYLDDRKQIESGGSAGVVVNSNEGVCNVAAGTFCQDKMREATNYAQDLPSDFQFRVTGKQDNNNNLSEGICEGEKGEGHENSGSPGVIIHHLEESSHTSTPASSSTAEQSIRALADAHLSEFRFPKLSSSIHGESGVPAPAPGCSPTKTAAPKGCVASTQNSTAGITSCSTDDNGHVDDDVCHSPDCHSFAENRKLENLRWSFKNGRLVFDSDNKNPTLPRDLNSNEVNLDSIESTDSILNLSSREVNKRIDENKSRLRYLEEKLKRAGLSGDSGTCSNNKKDNSQFKSDVAKQVVDESVSTLWEELKENENCGSSPSNNRESEESKQQQGNGDYRESYAEELRQFAGGGGFCQFDVSQVESFSPVLNGYCLVYDELDEESDSDEEFHVISLQEDPNASEEFYVISNNTKKMGTDSDRPKHNPDTENLRSLLKRPGKNRDKKSNRVVFNENKNEFFDADYIILIREECDYDDEDDDSVCTCNQHEMVRLTCCEPNCNCSVYDGYDQTPQSPKFAPPLEFVDAVTLSPPEGYKDMELGEQQLLALQQMARRGQQRRAVCRECSVTHTQEDDEDGE
ncbi:hypothetical protein WA026_003349 [Henosepilachna vigintioctopunctata]|uniref:Uncharacterized protein n=1 Tax=Henosepilachna vigintioctopunctata TaxID=420089 RepID=A0AAW1TPA6_9CUCU